MIRLIIVILLIVLLAGLAVLEQHVIQGAYNKLDRDIGALTATVRTLSDAKEDIDTEENIKKINDIYEWWLRQERTLSMLARHFDFAQVSTNLIYAKNFIQFNNDEEAMVGLLQVQYLIKTHSFNIGTNIQNVI